MMRRQINEHGPEKEAVYEVHGLRIRSEIPLSVPPSNGVAPVDMEVRWGDGLSDEHTPDGTLLAECTQPGMAHRLIETTNCYIWTLSSIYEFRISRDCREVTVHLAARANPGAVPIIVTGGVSSITLTLRSE